MKKAALPNGTMSRVCGPKRRSEGPIDVVPMQMRDQHGVYVLKMGRRNTSLAVRQVGDMAAQNGIG